MSCFTPLVAVVLASLPADDCRRVGTDVVCSEASFVLLAGGCRAAVADLARAESALTEAQAFRDIDARECARVIAALGQRIASLEGRPAPAVPWRWQHLATAAGIGLIAGLVAGFIIAR